MPLVSSQGYALAILLIAASGFPLPTIAEDSNAEQEAALEAILSTPSVPASQLPGSGTFYSAQRPELPPLPANLYGLSAWDLGEGVFLVDDTDIDYGRSTPATAAPGLPFGGTPMNSQPHTSNELWLAINAVTNGCTGRTADLTIYTPVGDTNSSYDVFYAPALDSPTDWQFLMRCPTNAIAQTNVFARYLCEEQGFFGIMEVATNCDLIVTTNVTPQQMAELLVPPWVTVTNATYTGAVVARGVFSNGNCCGLPIENGVILSSGEISNAIGPNDSNGSSVSGLETSGDTDLSELVGNNPTLNAAVLEFDVFSTNSIVLEFQYVFASEEYPEWIGEYNDPMAIFVSTNRVGSQWICEPTNNIALVPCSTNVFVGVGTVNGGDADGWATPTNPVFYLDNHDPLYSAAEPNAMDVSVFDVQYDGTTVLLAAHTVVTANVTNRLRIGVADYAGANGDNKYDSSVFLRPWSLAPCQ